MARSCVGVGPKTGRESPGAYVEMASIWARLPHDLSAQLGMQLEEVDHVGPVAPDLVTEPEEPRPRP